MKKAISKLFVSLFLIVYITTMSSCMFSIDPEPYGIWVSTDPELILYIDPASRDIIEAPNYGLYFGKYVCNDEDLSVFILIDMRQGSMEILDVNGVTDEYMGGTEYEYFCGSIAVRGNKMIYVLKPFWQEETGYEKIVFEKIEDYPMPEEE